MLDCVSDVLDYAWTGSRCGVALYVRPDRPAPAETDTVYADCPRICTCVNVGPVSVDFAVRRILWGVCIHKKDTWVFAVYVSVHGYRVHPCVARATLLAEL